MSLEAVAVVLTVVAVFLTARQVVWCWPLGMVSVAMYAVVFYDARLYAEVGLQALYFGLSGYGWWAWLHGGEERQALVVSRVGRQSGMGLLGAAALGGLALGFLLTRFTAASLPYLDATLAGFSVAAQWMQTRKYLEAWLLWIAVDVFYVGMFAFKGLHLTAALYAGFLVLAAFGYREWRQELETRAEDTA